MATKRAIPAEGKFAHVWLRGARKLPIVTDEEDLWMFLDSMYRANRRETEPMRRGALFTSGHALANTLVDVIDFCVLENHFHLQIYVKSAADASKFMQRLIMSVTATWRMKTGHCGRVFEGPYRRKILKTEHQVRTVFAYVSLKNAAEGAGVDPDTASLDELIRAAASYPFSSFPDYYLGRNLPIVSKGRFLERFPTIAALRKFASNRPRRNARGREK